MYTKLEEAAKELAKIIEDREDLFIPINVLVESESVANYFKSYFARSSKNVLMNVNFYTFNELIYITCLKGKNKSLLDELNYKLLILSFLKDNSCFETYLDKNSKDYSNKLYDLTCSLYSLFKSYDESLSKLEDNYLNIYLNVLDNARKNNMYTLKELILNNDYNSLGTIYTFGLVNNKNIVEKFLTQYKDVCRLDLCLKDISNKEVEFVGAPSKKREIEYVHSKISKLLLEENNKYGDFCVISPNINDYLSEIKQVFNQDNINYPYIPFNIKTKESTNSELYEFLKLMFDIISNKTITRKDFSEILNLDFVLNKFNIDSNTKDYIIKIVINNNIYENKDFIDLKNRIILSKFLDYSDKENDMVTIENISYLSYDSIELSDETIVIYSKLINSINKFIDNFNITSVDKDNIDILNETIKLFVEPNNKEYLKLNRFFSLIKYYDLTLDYSIFVCFVLDLIKYSSSNSFNTNLGVNFVSFNKNVVLDYKYVFFIGLSSVDFPHLDMQTEFDKRDNILSQSFEENRKAFILTYLNCTKFYASYVCENLKTAEEYFPSTLLEEIEPFYKIIKNKKISKLPLDETRDWAELFTNSEFANKMYNQNLMVEKKEDIVSFKSIDDENKNIKFKDIVNYLKEPLSYKANKVFPYNSSLFDDLNEEFQPFNAKKLDLISMFYETCVFVLENNIEESDNDIKMSFYNRYKLEKKVEVLSEEISLEEYNNIWVNVFKYKNFVCGLGKYSIIDPFSINLSYEEQNFKISTNKKYLKVINDSITYYLEIKDLSKDVSEKEFIAPYVISLLDTLKESSGEEKEIVLNLNNDKKVKNYTLSSLEAKEILNEIYFEMKDFDNIYFLPVRYLTDNVPDNFYDFINSAKQDLIYFKDNKMFNFETDLGYKDDNYLEKLNENISKLISMVKYAIKEEETEVSEENGDSKI